MRKSSVFILGATLSFAFVINGMQTVKVAAEDVCVYVGGMSAGFTLRTNGVQIIGICEVVTENGTSAPAAEAGIHAGDVIVKAGGISINSISELNEIINKTQGKGINVEIYRGKTQICVEVLPAKDKLTQNYKIGVLVRDCVSGIGTVTYIEKESGRFGALGHSVTGENRQKMQITDGKVYECSIIGVKKGVRGAAGELRGMFLNEKLLGNAEKLTDCGIFGNVSTEFQGKELINAIADSHDVKPGGAYIYSTVNGVCPKRYEIEIVKVDKNNKENKNYVIKIVDEELLEETGGIVQGMSGSPILQNGYLVGAVTHVFLNDPTRGYGIDICTMLEE